MLKKPKKTTSYNLIETFSYPDNGKPNDAIWSYDLGGGGWGNGELQVYTDDVRNVKVVQDDEADGHRALAITALRDKVTTSLGEEDRFTSGRITTKQKFQHAYGRFEARIKIPEGGKGVWPAFWLLGANKEQVNWPQCGEIDIMEWIGSDLNHVYGTLHGPGYSGAKGIQGAYTPVDGRGLSGVYRVYSVDWSPDAISWHVDGGTPYHTVTRASLVNGQEWVFDHPFYIILNLAVGGDWPKSPDDKTKFPQTMYVDYVRVSVGIAQKGSK